VRRAGGVQTRGAFAVFGQLAMMRGSQAGLLKQNDGAQEGKRMRERVSASSQAAQRCASASHARARPRIDPRGSTLCARACFEVSSRPAAPVPPLLPESLRPPPCTHLRALHPAILQEAVVVFHLGHLAQIQQVSSERWPTGGE